MLKIIALLLLLLPSSAHAIDTVSSETDFVNGAIGIVDPLATTKGGTAIAAYATGDIIYANGVNTLTVLTGNGGTKLFLTMDTNVPSWAAIVDNDVPNDIVINHTSVGTLTLDQHTVNPTNEGQIGWDATNNQIEVGNTGTTKTFIPAGTLTNSKVCTYNSANNEIDCNSVGGVNSTIFFSSIGLLGTGTNTIFANPGDVSSSETPIEVPLQASTWSNLRCKLDAAPGGTNIVITARTGTCAATMADSTLSCTIGPTATSCSDVTNTMNVASSGDCISFKIAGTATTTSVHAICSVERSA